MRDQVRISKLELALHNHADDCWISIDGKIYDVTQFLKQHPGGERIILDVAGTEVTEQFLEVHSVDVLRKYGPKLLVGTLEGVIPVFENPPKTLSEIPYAFTATLNNWKSPFYNESHKKFQKVVRTLLNQHLTPFCESWEAVGMPISDKLQRKLGQLGQHAACIGPGAHIGKYTPSLGDVSAKEFDYFHEQIVHVLRVQIPGCGVADSIGTPITIGLPPIKIFGLGSKQLRERVIKECLTGEKRICLAVSEPLAGSDVANVQTSAVKSTCGKFYIVNGIKKQITGGLKADYFTTAVKIENKLSFILVPRLEGLKTKRIKTRYSKAGGTSLVTYENVRVPVDYLIGKEGYGFKMIMHNFNHERWMIACLCLGSCRIAIEYAFKWLMQRKAFGKPLIANPALRQKLGQMVYKTEAIQAYVDSLTWQLCTMSFKEQNRELGAPIALMKSHCAKECQWVIDMCVQLLGGRGVTDHGMGSAIARARGISQFYGILGGTNEVLVDFSIRQAMAKIPAWSRL